MDAHLATTGTYTCTTYLYTAISQDVTILNKMAYVLLLQLMDGLFIVSLQEMIMCMKYNKCIMYVHRKCTHHETFIITS